MDASFDGSCLSGHGHSGHPSIFGLFLLPVTEALGTGREVFSLALALQNLLWGIASPFAGALADKFGAGRVAAIGTLFCAGGLVVMASFVSPSGLMMGQSALAVQEYQLRWELLRGRLHLKSALLRLAWLQVSAHSGSLLSCRLRRFLLMDMAGRYLCCFCPGYLPRCWHHAF